MELINRIENTTCHLDCDHIKCHLLRLSASELAKQAEYIAGQQQTIRSMQQNYSVEACHRQLDEIDELKKQVAALKEQP